MDSLFTKLSAKQLRQAASIKDEISRLEHKLARVVGNATEGWPAERIPKSRLNRAVEVRTPSSRRIGRRRRKMSAAAKKRLSAIAKQRWKKARAAGKTAL